MKHSQNNSEHLQGEKIFIAKKNNLSSVPDFFVCWRGSVTVSEWASDLDFSKTTCSFLKNGEKVHRGFLNIYTGDDELGESPRKVVLDYLDSINEKTPDYNLWITGHSLGAALAVLNICDIVVNNYNKNAKMYNFAGPKVGDSAFATTFKKYIGTNCCNTNASNNCCSWRIVNTIDEVPQLPPSNIVFTKTGYVHVNGCSGLSVCNNANSNDNSLNGLFEITSPSGISPHGSGTYLSILKKLKTI
jgi:triacylglycerol lipase